MTPEELQRLIEQQGSTPPPSTTPPSTAPGTTTPTSTAPGTTTPSSTVPTPTIPTSAPPPATLPTSTPPATTQTGGVAPATLSPSATQPTTSTVQGVLPPVVQPTTSTTGIQTVTQPTTSTTGVQSIAQPTTSSTGVTPVVQPTTSSTGITPYVTPGINPPPPLVTSTTPQSTPPPTTAPGVAPASPPTPASTGGTVGFGHGGGTAPLPAGPHGTQTDTGRQATPPPITDQGEPESPEAMLARLRAERDADNAVSLRGSDTNRTGWLAEVEQILQGLRTPTSQAAAYGAALFERLADYFRELLGHEPWADSAMGKVLRVDRPTKTCRVQIAADALNPAAVPGQRKVSYGFAAPRVGQTVPVHFPTRVTRSGPLQAEPDPEHLPWCKVAGFLWTLYFHVEPGLWRVPFIPDASTPSDHLQDAPDFPQPGLVGSQDANAQVYQSVEPWLVFLDDSSRAALPTYQTVVHYDGALGTTADATTPTGRLIHVVGVAPDDTDGSVRLLGFEPVSTTTGFSAEFPFPRDSALRVVRSADGGATWSTPTGTPTIEFLRGIENPTSHHTSALVAIYRPANLPLPQDGAAGFQTLVAGPYGAVGTPLWLFGATVGAGTPIPAGDPVTQRLFVVTPDGALHEQAIVPPSALYNEFIAPVARQTPDGTVVVFAASGAQDPNPPQWWRAETDWSLTGLAWTALDGRVAFLLAVSADGQSLVAAGFDDLGPPYPTAPRYASDDGGLTWSALPSPWGDPAIVGADLRFVNTGGG